MRYCFLLIGLALPYLLQSQSCAHGKAALLTAHGAQAEKSAYDMRWAEAQWQVDPAQRYIQGQVTHHVTWKQDTDTFYTELSASLVIDSVKYRGQQLSVFRQGPYEVSISLPAAVMAGETDSITLYYQGQPLSDGLGSFEQAMLPNGDYWLWTLSQPYGARDWWPVVEQLNDKLDSIHILLTTPVGYVGVSNGVLQQTDTANGTVTRTFVHRYPVTPYLVAIAAAPYVSWTDSVALRQGTLPVVNYVLPEDTVVAKTQIPALYPVFSYFDSLFLPYPFMQEQYGHVRFGYGGGMEHQTMSFLGNYNYELLVHELAHQWFGNLTTCGSWQDIWLNEGFAEYLTGISFERFSPNQFWPLFMANREESILSAPDGSVWVEDTTQVFRIFNARLSYFKGAWVLHQLRWVMGDEAFWQGCREWLSRPQLAFGYGRTAEFRSVMEAASGLDLAEFFRDWVYGEGQPAYKLYWRQTGNLVEGWLTQTTSHPSVDLFDMPVPVRVTYDWGDTTFILQQTQPYQPFRLLVDGPIQSLMLDPDNRLLGAVNVFPLPSDVTFLVQSMGNGRFHLLPSRTDAQVGKWRIINMAGQEVQSGTAGSWTGMVDLAMQSAGVYIVQVQVDAANVNVRLIR